MSGTWPRSVLHRTAGESVIRALLRGLAVSVHGNSQAFGYSITITASYGAVSSARGNPDTFELLGFAVLAVAAFSVLNVLVHQMLPDEPDSERGRVLLVSTATDFLAVGLAVGAAVGLSAAVRSPVVWFLVAPVVGLVYVLVQSIELAVGRAESDS